MRVHRAQQGSLEWLAARAGIATASEFDQLLTPKFEVRSGEMPKTYLARKLAEAWTGTPALGFNSIDMDFGSILENEAIPWFELYNGVTVQRVGLCTTDDGRIGCSPDGLIGDDSGLEVKCPQMATHVGYLLKGEVPKDYLVQIHGALYVTGRSQWRFLSYCRGFPPLMLTVNRDAQIQAQIGEALTLFLAQFDAAMKRLEEINGGPPRRAAVPPPQPPSPEPDDDLIP